MNAHHERCSDHPNDALANAAGLSPQMAVYGLHGDCTGECKKEHTAAGIALAKAQELLPKIPLREQMPIDHGDG